MFEPGGDEEAPVSCRCWGFSAAPTQAAEGSPDLLPASLEKRKNAISWGYPSMQLLKAGFMG